MLEICRDEKVAKRDQADTTGLIPGDVTRAAFIRLAEDGTDKALRDAAGISIMLGTGIRRSEVCAIDMEQIADDRADIRAVSRKSGRKTFLFLPPGTVRHLTRWLDARGDQPGPLFRASKRGRNNGFQDKRIANRAVENLVKRWLGETVRTHDLRRTYITRLLDNGLDTLTVAKLADHQSPETTMVYDRRGAEVRREATDAIVIPFYDFAGHAD